MTRAEVQTPQGCEHFRSQADMPPHLVDALTQIAIEFGDTYAAYLVTERDREYFWAQAGAASSAFAAAGDS